MTSLHRPKINNLFQSNPITIPHLIGNPVTPDLKESIQRDKLKNLAEKEDVRDYSRSNLKKFFEDGENIHQRENALGPPQTERLGGYRKKEH